MSHFAAPNTFVVSMDHSAERRASIEEQMNSVGLEFTYWSGFDGITSELVHKDRKVPQGHIGCYLAHYFLWQKIITDFIPWAMIFEDDARFVPDFSARFPDVEKRFFSDNIQFLFLGGREYTNVYGHGRNIDQMLRVPKFQCQTFAYVLTREYCRKLHANMKAVNHHVDNKMWDSTLKNDMGKEAFGLRDDLVFDQRDRFPSYILNTPK